MGERRSAARQRALLLVLLWAVGGCVPPWFVLEAPDDAGGSSGGNGGGSSGGGGTFAGGGGSIDPGSPSGCLGLGVPSDVIHQAGFDQLNLYRRSNGREPLRYSTTLQRAADLHAQDMYNRNFFSHINPNGAGPGDRAVAAGFCHPYGGENIAMGQNDMETVTEAMAAWKASPTHHANMLYAGFKYVGVGYYHVQIGTSHCYYWVQLFAVDY